MTDENQINRKRLLWAGFVAILAAGLGFGVRGGIFANWANDFGFSGAQLGMIGGAGFTGFCFGIIIGGVVVDKIGYGKVVFLAFLLHIISYVVTFLAVGSDPGAAYHFLFWGMFIFAYANGTLEAVSNPLVSTLFPEARTHYLNILHASWPLGMIFGGLIGWTLGSGENAWAWEYQLILYLIPTVVYGVMFMGQKYPKSEASEKGLKFSEMFKEIGLLSGGVVCFMLYLFVESTLAPLGIFSVAEGEGPSVVPKIIAAIIGLGLLFGIGVMTKFSFGSVLLFVLFIAHALIGAVELGTDGWIQNITGAILSEKEGKILFVITSLIMFLLRFCAHFIEKRIGLSPIGLLFACSILAVLGLNLVAAVTSFGPALGALAIYAIGKTFFWPTMLAVVGDRFPSTGAVAMSLMGGVGMMSAGLIGSAGLGYFKDRLAAEELQTANPELAVTYASEGAQSSFLGFEKVTPIDGRRLEEYKKIAKEERTADQETIVQADIRGNRRTLMVDSLIPAAMAVIFLGILLYFKAKGGYRPLTIETEKATGGVEGPVR